MKKEDLLALGLTEEQASKVLEENGIDVGKAIKKAKEDNVDPKELKRLKEIDAKYKELQDADLTDAEKVQKALKAAEEAKLDFAKKSNKLEAEKILVGAGLTEEDYKDLIDTLVSEDADKSKASATAFATLVTNQKAAVEKATKEKLMDDTPGTGGAGGNGKNDEKTEDVKFAEEIANSFKSGTDNTQDVFSNY